MGRLKQGDQTPVPARTVSREDRQQAETALHTANSFIHDIITALEKVADKLEFPAYAPELLNTLSLAAKQIQAAETIDPSATITITLENETERTFSITQLKALALLYEGMIHSQADRPKKAIARLATAEVSSPCRPDGYPEIAVRALLAPRHQSGRTLS